MVQFCAVIIIANLPQAFSYFREGVVMRGVPSMSGVVFSFQPFWSRSGQDEEDRSQMKCQKTNHDTTGQLTHDQSRCAAGNVKKYILSAFLVTLKTLLKPPTHLPFDD